MRCQGYPYADPDLPSPGTAPYLPGSPHHPLDFLVLASGLTIQKNSHTPILTPDLEKHTSYITHSLIRVYPSSGLQDTFCYKPFRINTGSIRSASSSSSCYILSRHWYRIKCCQVNRKHQKTRIADQSLRLTGKVPAYRY